MQRRRHWRERAIERSEIISDAWEVIKAYAGRAAEWILFSCMVVNIIEILPGSDLPVQLVNLTLGVQVVMLDVGGFALATMGYHAEINGDLKGASKAKWAGRFLIGLMIVTLISVSMALLWPQTKSFTDIFDKVLILVRVGMTVVYGHVIHELRKHRYDAPRAAASEVDIHALIDWSLVGQAAFLQSQIDDVSNRLSSEIARLSSEMANQIAPPLPEFQATIQAVGDYLMPEFQAAIQALQADIFRQKTLIEEVQIQAKRLPEKATFSGKTSGKIQATNLPEKVLRLVPAQATREELIAEARRLYETEALSTYQIGEKLGKSAKTVQSWLASGKNQAEIQAESEEIQAEIQAR